ncbi:hypothetical protein D3C75_716320 [compost metagenome]
MNIILLGICASVLLCALAFAAYRLGQRRHTASIVQTIKLSPAILPKLEESGCELALVDENGAVVIQSSEIRSIPAHAHRLDASGSTLHRVRHLASDLFKGVTGIPNKTVELVFKQDIQQGLADGTYTLMKTKSGEVLADAVDSSGTIVGKGRVLQGGKVRQLASGAFQLVSIAVAQSHLADIERSLGSIKSSVAELLSRQENEDKARISGAIDYFQEIAEHMKQLRTPDELSQQKCNAIEGVIRDFYTWRNKLNEDLSTLIDQIANLKDQDSFGTGSTYNALKEQVEKVKPLLRRRDLLLQIASAANFITAYLDPTQTQFSRAQLDDGAWVRLVEEFKAMSVKKSAEHLSSALFNSNEILSLRKAQIQGLASEHSALAIEQQKGYEQVMRNLNQNVHKLMGIDGNIRIAITFDDQGEIRDSAIIR